MLGAVGELAADASGLDVFGSLETFAELRFKREEDPEYAAAKNRAIGPRRVAEAFAARLRASR